MSLSTRWAAVPRSAADRASDLSLLPEDGGLADAGTAYHDAMVLLDWAASDSINSPDVQPPRRPDSWAAPARLIRPLAR
jgi:hypothetical protein